MFNFFLKALFIRKRADERELQLSQNIQNTTRVILLPRGIFTAIRLALTVFKDGRCELPNVNIATIFARERSSENESKL